MQKLLGNEWFKNIIKDQDARYFHEKITHTFKRKVTGEETLW
jgi:hypothetical protein